MHQSIVALLRAQTYEFRGRVTGDPKLKTFDSGSQVANADLAVDHPDRKRDERDKTDWLRLEIWGNEAAEFADTIAKGSLIDVKGRVKSSSYVSTKTGETVEQWILRVTSWSLVAAPRNAAAPTQSTLTQPNAWATSDTSDEEVPF
jgi:single-strand DNA-binding protein